MNRNKVAAGMGAFLGGVLWGAAFSQGIGLLPFAPDGLLLNLLCPMISGVVSFVYLTLLRSPDYDAEDFEEEGLFPCFFGEFASALPISFLCWVAVTVFYVFLSHIML